jgi:hypothetical protein
MDESSKAMSVIRNIKLITFALFILNVQNYITNDCKTILKIVKDSYRGYKYLAALAVNNAENKRYILPD